MKRIVLAFFLTAFFAIPGFSQAVAEGVAVTKEGREIFATIAKWADAIKSRDTKALDNIFEEYLIVTTADGKTRGKSEELEILKPNPQLGTVSIRNEDVKVRIFGEAAVATGLFVNAGKDVRTSFRYTAMFVYKEGRWQLAALHISPPVKSGT